MEQEEGEEEEEEQEEEEKSLGTTEVKANFYFRVKKTVLQCLILVEEEEE